MMAKVTQDISFRMDGKLFILIPKGTTITVDPMECVGLYNGLHFHIESDEYILVNNLINC